VLAAWMLARAWPDAELIVIADSGHTGSPRMAEVLHDAGDRLYAAVTARMTIG
jgi:proline iminopeptidase